MALLVINNMSEDLTQKKCVPCKGGVSPFTADEIEEYMKQLKTPWEVVDDLKIQQKFSFKDFVEAMAFVNKVAELAEDEGHHPDIHVVGYNTVTIELNTHAIGGLSINDFIVARKIEVLNAS